MCLASSSNPGVLCAITPTNSYVSIFVLQILPPSSASVNVELSKGSIIFLAPRKFRIFSTNTYVASRGFLLEY